MLLTVDILLKRSQSRLHFSTYNHTAFETHIQDVLMLAPGLPVENNQPPQLMAVENYVHNCGELWTIQPGAKK